MSLQHFGKATLRVAKNYTKGYSDVQAKVREATSNDPWGPSGTQMNEIAQMTYNQNDFVEIMEMLDKRLNDKGKNWRHVFKALTVLDYLVHAGSENVVIYFKDNIYIIKTLKEFQYVDEYGKDQGANVRQKAKDITNLLQDDSRLREERRTRANMRDRLVGGQNNFDEFGAPENENGNENDHRRSRDAPRKRPTREDDELKRAIEESKRSLVEEQARVAEENDLQKAIDLSKAEEERRNKTLEESNSRSLFDDHNPQSSSNNPFPLVDTSLQPQYTQLQPQFTAVAPQFTSFNPYQQQALQEAQQAEYLRQQQEWQRQQYEAQAQAQAQAQLQAQQAAAAQAAQDEYNRQQAALFQQQQQQQQQQQFLAAQQPHPLAVQPTGFGSNNPFAPSTFGQQSPQATSPSPSSPLTNFSLPSTYSGTPAPSLSTPTSSQASSTTFNRPTKADADHAHLANLFANRDDGQDTFGNTGNLRYGQGAGRTLAAQPTGYNPFARPQSSQTQSEQPFFTI